MIEEKPERLLWLNGKIVPLNDAVINVLAPTSQFGANVFEGIRCYWNDKNKQLYAFRLNEHYKRLQDSARMFRIVKKYSDEELKNYFFDVIKANNFKENIAVRQTIFLDGFGTWSDKAPVGMFIAPIAKDTILDKSGAGIKCGISSWERISDKNMSPRIKVGANYINSRLAQLEAFEHGYDSAIFMNNAGKVSEGAGSCFMMVRDGALITPPLSASILESITRDTILEIAEDLKIKTEVRDIDRTELYICDEAFLCGTAVEITPIKSVDGFSVRNGEKGPITSALSERYLKILRGEIKDKEKWLTGVY